MYLCIHKYVCVRGRERVPEEFDVISIVARLFIASLENRLVDKKIWRKIAFQNFETSFIVSTWRKTKPWRGREEWERSWRRELRSFSRLVTWSSIGTPGGERDDEAMEKWLHDDGPISSITVTALLYFAQTTAFVSLMAFFFSFFFLIGSLVGFNFKWRGTVYIIRSKK